MCRSQDLNLQSFSCVINGATLTRHESEIGTFVVYRDNCILPLLFLCLLYTLNFSRFLLISQMPAVNRRFLFRAYVYVMTKRRKCWVKPLFRRRGLRGEYVSLVDELLVGDEEHFMIYMRMSRESFSALLDILKPSLRKKGVNFRSRVSVASFLLFLSQNDCKSKP